MALWIMVYTWSVSYGMMLICAGSIPVNKKPKADRASLRTKAVVHVAAAEYASNSRNHEIYVICFG